MGSVNTVNSCVKIRQASVNSDCTQYIAGNGFKVAVIINKLKPSESPITYHWIFLETVCHKGELPVKH